MFYVAPAAPIPTTGLTGWWDADDATTFTYGSLGNNVTEWRDKSGASHHAVAAGGPTTPWPLRNVTINGRTALNIAPPGGPLLITAFAAAYTAGEIFIVLDLTAKNDGGYLQNWGTGSGQHYPYSGSTVYESWGRTDRPSIGTPPVDLLTPHIYNLRASAGSYIAAWNGTVGFSGSCTVGFVGRDPYEIGAVGNPPNGYIGEIVMYNRVLSTVERQQVESYLATKWGTPVPAFNPLSIGWTHAFWADDPGWTPPADGAAVTSWRNAGTNGTAIGDRNPGDPPTYRAAYTNLNNHRAVGLDGNDWLYAIVPTMAQPNHIFVVGWLDPTHAADPSITDDNTGGSRHLIRNLGTGGVLLYAGQIVNVAGAGRTGPFCMAALFNGASSALRTNGTAYTVAADVGPHTCGAHLTIGCGSGVSTFFKGGIAFFGVKDIALTAQEITDLETWAKNYYGVPIP